MAMVEDSYAAPVGSGMMAGQQEQMDETERAEMDEQELLNTFKKFDADGSGSIDAEELKMAMEQLGIKVTMSSVRKVLHVIDTDGSGTIEWDEFFEFFQKVKSPEEFKKILGGQNAQYLDYKIMVKEDPNFERRFFIPPGVVASSKFMGHQDNVECVRWVPNTDNFMSCSLDGCIKIWNATTGKCEKDIKYTEEENIGMYIVELMDPGVHKKVLTGLGRRDMGVAMYDLDAASDQKPIIQFTQTGTPAYSIGIHQNRTHFVMGNKSGQINYYDLTKPDPLFVSTDIHEGVVYSAQFNPENHNSLLTASSDGLVRMTDIRSLTEYKINTTVEDAAAADIVFNAAWKNSDEFLSVGADFCLKKWDIRNWKKGPIENYFGHTAPVRNLTLCPNSKYCATAANDGCVRVWCVDERENIIQKLEEVDMELDGPENQREKLEEAIKAEQAKDFDPENDKMPELSGKLYDLVQQLRDIYGRRKFYDHVRAERDNMNCVQAIYNCDGHGLGVSSLAWRDVGPGKSQLVTGAQDQTSLLYNLSPPDVYDFVRWGDEIEQDKAEGGYGA